MSASPRRSGAHGRSGPTEGGQAFKRVRACVAAQAFLNFRYDSSRRGLLKTPRQVEHICDIEFAGPGRVVKIGPVAGTLSTIP